METQFFLFVGIFSIFSLELSLFFGLCFLVLLSTLISLRDFFYTHWLKLRTIIVSRKKSPVAISYYKTRIKRS